MEIGESMLTFRNKHSNRSHNRNLILGIKGILLLLALDGKRIRMYRDAEIPIEYIFLFNCDRLFNECVFVIYMSAIFGIKLRNCNLLSSLKLILFVY